MHSLLCSSYKLLRQKCSYIKQVDKGSIIAMKDFESGCFEHEPFIICSNEGQMLKTSDFQIFMVVNLTFINSFDKTTCLFHSPTEKVPQFL